MFFAAGSMNADMANGKRFRRLYPTATISPQPGIQTEISVILPLASGCEASRHGVGRGERYQPVCGDSQE